MKNNIKRIEKKTSRTAEMTCLSRAVSFYEKNPLYKSNDYIAPKLLPVFLKPFLNLKLVRKFYKDKLSPKGIYEYVIARTKYIDSIFRNAILNEFDQILIFGAGFDSRGIRLLDVKSKTRVFELDVPITQNANINQLKKRKIAINPNIIFIPIDFTKESIKEKLIQYGFKKNKKSLFVLEGILMYLTGDTVELTFKVIEEFSANNSEIVFDYIYSSVLRKENIYYGEKDIYDILIKANEPWTFGIEKDEIISFLSKYNFRLIENNNSEILENNFFKDENGRIIGKVNGTHCIAYAKKCIH